MAQLGAAAKLPDAVMHLRCRAVDEIRIVECEFHVCQPLGAAEVPVLAVRRLGRNIEQPVGCVLDDRDFPVPCPIHDEVELRAAVLTEDNRRRIEPAHPRVEVILNRCFRQVCEHVFFMQDIDLEFGRRLQLFQRIEERGVKMGIEAVFDEQDPFLCTDAAFHRRGDLDRWIEQLGKAFVDDHRIRRHSQLFEKFFLGTDEAHRMGDRFPTEIQPVRQGRYVGQPFVVVRIHHAARVAPHCGRDTRKNHVDDDRGRSGDAVGVTRQVDLVDRVVVDRHIAGQLDILLQHILTARVGSERDLAPVGSEVAAEFGEHRHEVELEVTGDIQSDGVQVFADDPAFDAIRRQIAGRCHLQNGRRPGDIYLRHLRWQKRRQDRRRAPGTHDIRAECDLFSMGTVMIAALQKSDRFISVLQIDLQERGRGIQENVVGRFMCLEVGFAGGNENARFALKMRDCACGIVDFDFDRAGRFADL